MSGAGDDGFDPVLPDRIEHWSVDELVPYDRNPRTHSEAQIAKLAASIAEFGFTNPVLVDRGSREIIAGHGRLAAARWLGLDVVPVIPFEHLTEAQRRAYVIADNRLALDAGWDDELLAAELEALGEEGFDLSLTGFSAEELADLMGGEAGGTGRDPDERPAPPQGDPVSRTGDVWILGEHRLLCGDSRAPASIEAVLGSAKAKAHAVWTDPPYGVAYESAAGRVANDDLSDEDLYALMQSALAACVGRLVAGGAVYMAHAEGGSLGLVARRAFLDAGLKLSACLIWRKNQLVMGRGDYHWQHEPILYGWKPGKAHRWYGGRGETTIHEFESDLPFAQIADHVWQLSLGEETLIIRGRDLTIERAHSTVRLEEKPRASAQHPTMKPVALIERMLVNSTRPGDVVLDPFGGSGSTLIAAHRLGRHARLVELEPKHCDSIVARWQQYTGIPARLEETGMTYEQVARKR